MADYELTTQADDDLLAIARYSFRVWGRDQAKRYESGLRTAFESIGNGKAKAKTLLTHRPDIQVVRCEHHYIFYQQRKNRSPLIIAILHERMNMINRLKRRLASS